ncbi:MAG: hypothetical protein U0V04_17150 [Spirosomataceae bacterium]|jgi:hypothetical protein
MKNVVFIVICGLVFNSTYSQNITFDNFLNLRAKSIGSIEEFLTSKGWELLDAEEPVNQNMGKLEFSYNRSSYSEKAESFFIVYFSDVSVKYNIINLQINNSNIYNTYVNRLKFLGFKLEKSFVNEGKIVKYYIKNGLSIILTITSRKESNIVITSYLVTILRKEDLKRLIDDNSEETYSAAAVVDSAAAIVDEYAREFENEESEGEISGPNNSSLDKVEVLSQSKSFLEYLGKGLSSIAFNFSKVPDWEAKGLKWFCSSKGFGGINQVKDVQLDIISIFEDKAEVHARYTATDIVKGYKAYNQLFTLTKFEGNVWLITNIEDL